MAKLAACFLVSIVLYQSVGVLSRQINLDDYDFDQFLPGQNNNNNNVQPTPADPLTTTTASPQLTNCLNRCQTTPQYNPVCGTNEVSYPNIQRMQCAQGCGIRVQVAHAGTCGRSPGGK